MCERQFPPACLQPKNVVFTSTQITSRVGVPHAAELQAPGEEAVPVSTEFTENHIRQNIRQNIRQSTRSHLSGKNVTRKTIKQFAIQARFIAFFILKKTCIIQTYFKISKRLLYITET